LKLFTRQAKEIKSTPSFRVDSLTPPLVPRRTATSGADTSVPHQPSSNQLAETRNLTLSIPWLTREPRTRWLLVIALLPFLLAEVFTFFSMLLAQGSILTCTQVSFLFVSFLWILSFVSIYWLPRDGYTDEIRYHRIILMKDILISAFTLNTLFTITCNDSSACMGLGHSWPRGLYAFNMNERAEFLYAILAGACIAVQLFVPSTVMAMYHKGRTLLFRSEEQKHMDFLRLHGLGGM
jgi:hypothetical protein